MRFMMIVKATKESEAGVLPDPKDLEEMGKFNDSMLKAGVMLAGDGLQARFERNALRPLYGLFFGLHLDDPITGNQFFRFGKRSVDYSPPAIRKLDAHSLGTRLKPGKIQQHAGFH